MSTRTSPQQRIGKRKKRRKGKSLRDIQQSSQYHQYLQDRQELETVVQEQEESQHTKGGHEYHKPVGTCGLIHRNTCGYCDPQIQIFDRHR